MADPDLELKGGKGGGGFVFTCPADFSSFCEFFSFVTKLRWELNGYLKLAIVHILNGSSKNFIVA